MASKTYTLFVDGEDAVEYGSKKTAVKYGDASGKTYQVQSPSGAVVHAVGRDNIQDQFSDAVTGQAIDDLVKTSLSHAETAILLEDRHEHSSTAEALLLTLAYENVGDKKSSVTYDWPGNYAIEMVPFVQEVAKGFGGLKVKVTQTPGRLNRQTEVSGDSSIVKQFKRLMDSLQAQVMDALKVWQKENVERRRTLTDQQRYVEHRNFIKVYGVRVGLRLKETRLNMDLGALDEIL